MATYQVNNNGLIILLHTYEVVKVSTLTTDNVPGKCLEVLGRGIIDRMRKTKAQLLQPMCITVKK